MKPPFPSITPTWHADTYPAINPTNPSNSQSGKTVVITGAGSGIGQETAVAFAEAGAKHLVLVGRTESTLLETQKRLPEGKCTSIVCVASVSNVEQMKKVAEATGSWDIFVLNAGHIARPTSIAEADLDDWWSSYETNCKSILITAKLFLPIANPPGASILAVTAGGVVLPPHQVTGLSAYMSSKTAQIKLIEWLVAENPNLFACSVHPGVIDTNMLRDSGLSGLPYDAPTLPAHFLVWLSQPKTKFLNGRFLWVNWDVDELYEQAEEIQKGALTTMNAVGWPYTHIEARSQLLSTKFGD